MSLDVLNIGESIFESFPVFLDFFYFDVSKLLPNLKFIFFSFISIKNKYYIFIIFLNIIKLINVHFGL